MRTRDLVQVQVVNGFRMADGEDLPGLVLEEPERGIMVFVWMTPEEISAVLGSLNQPAGVSPSPTERTLGSLTQLGGRVQRVVIHLLVEHSFGAELTIQQGKKRFTVKARPSEAIGLALRAKAPIYVTRATLDVAAPPASDVVETEAPQPDSTPGKSSFVYHSWGFLLALQSLQNGESWPYDLQGASAAWPPDFVARAIMWEGERMVAVQIPCSDNPAWMIVHPNVWSAILETAKRQKCERNIE